MHIYTIYGHEFGERVLGNLANAPKFCTACGLACTECRADHATFAADIFGVHKVPEMSQDFIDDATEHLPTTAPNCDLLLAIGIHSDILSELPSLVERSKAKAVIVPIENRKWCPPSLQRNLQAELREVGVESAFPKPFCELKETGLRVIDQFVMRYKIGRPSLEIQVRDNMIRNAKVLRSAPCGSTWYVAQQIKWHDLRDMPALEQVISSAHHGYPCTASMETDPELGDTILHKSGYLIRGAVKDALANALCYPLVATTEL